MFYTYSQNNSGGYFVADDAKGVGEYMIIEAATAAEADDLLGSIGAEVSGFDNSCPCCGDRWPTGWMDDDDGTAQPEIYGQPLSECKQTWMAKKAFVHHLDGRVERVELLKA